MLAGIAKSGAVRFALLLALVFAGSFAAARASSPVRSRPDPVRLINGVPVGVKRSEAGALAAADNYVAVGIADSLDQRCSSRSHRWM